MDPLDVSYLPATGHDLIRFRDPAAGYVPVGDLDGIDMPKPEYAADAIFDRPGSFMSHVRMTDRHVIVPLGVIGRNPAEIRQRVRGLVSRMNPLLGSGWLIVARRSTGIARKIRCRYEQGMDGLLETAGFEDEWYVFPLEFRCFDPYWLDDFDYALTFDFQADLTRTFLPLFSDAADVGPRFGKPLDVFAPLSLRNEGDDWSWPTWTIHGPISNPKLSASGVGVPGGTAIIDLSNAGGLSIGSAETLTIVTDPYAPSLIVTPGTDNAFKYLTDDSILFGLPPYATTFDAELTITATGTGIDAASTAVTLTYQQRYLSA